MLLFLLAALAAAQPRCPKDAKAQLNLHPFRAVQCPGVYDAAYSTAPVKVALKASPETAAVTLSKLVGVWEGWLAFGMERYKLTAELTRQHAFKVEAMDHRTLVKRTLVGELDPRGGASARVKAKLAEYPMLEAAGTLKFGAAGAEGYDYDAVLSDDKGASLHARFKVRGEELTVTLKDLRRPKLDVNETTLRRRLQP